MKFRATIPTMYLHCPIWRVAVLRAVRHYSSGRLETHEIAVSKQ